MDNLKDFTKNLDILYVEDEDSAREILSKILKRFFRSVDICENGLDAYLLFQKNYKIKKYDLIISDINMPKMDGLDMLEKIRELDKEIPTILITARNEANVMMRAIELQVTNYIMKPIDIDAVSNVISKACEKIHLKNALKQKQKELETYLKTIEQIALIGKIDLNGNFSYINENYLFILQIDEEKILNSSFKLFPEIQNNQQIYNEIWETINQGNNWEGVLKNIDSENETIYLKTTIMPIFDEDTEKIKEFISLNYLVTDQEKEKKELNKKMLQNITHIKKETYLVLKDKEKYEQEINKLNHHIQTLQLQVLSFNDLKANLLKQLEAYEKSNLNQVGGKLSLLKQKNKELEQLTQIVKSLKLQKTQLQQNIEKFKETISIHEHNLQNYRVNEIKHKNIIKELEDVVKDYEKEIEEHKEKKFFNL